MRRSLLNAGQALLGESWLFNYYVNCDGQDSHKQQRQVLAFFSLPLPHKYKQRRVARKASMLVKYKMR